MTAGEENREESDFSPVNRLSNRMTNRPKPGNQVYYQSLSAKPKLSETKKAFYAGALAVISLTARMFSNEQEVTEEDVNSYDKLVNEIVSVCKAFTGEHEMN